MFHSNISRQKYQKAKGVQLGGVGAASAPMFAVPALKSSHLCNVPTSSISVSVEKNTDGTGIGEKSATELADELRAAHEIRSAENADRMKQYQRNLSRRVHNYHEQQRGVDELLEEEKKQKYVNENVPPVDMTHHVIQAFPVRAAQLRMEDAKEKSSEYWSKRRWYMEQERKKAKKRIEKNQTEERSRREYAAMQAEIARQNDELMRQQQYQNEENHRRVIEEEKRQKELERQKKIHNAEKKRVQRYLEGLRVKLIQRLAYNNIQLPPLCKCSTDPLAHNVANCHRSCPYFKQPETYNEALMEMLNTYGITL